MPDYVSRGTRPNRRLTIRSSAPMGLPRKVEKATHCMKSLVFSVFDISTCHTAAFTQIVVLFSACPTCAVATPQKSGLRIHQSADRATKSNYSGSSLMQCILIEKSAARTCVATTQTLHGTSPHICRDQRVHVDNGVASLTMLCFGQWLLTMLCFGQWLGHRFFTTLDLFAARTCLATTKTLHSTSPHIARDQRIHVSNVFASLTTLSLG